MNIIYKKISLDIHNIASQLTLAVKKGDTARGLIITLTENGKVYNIPDYCYATFSAKKSDGTFVSSGCTIKDNKIIYDFSESPQLTKVPGRVDCEASLFSKDEAQITSPLFTLYVYRTIKDEYEEEIASSDEFKTLDKLISETTEVLEESKVALEESKEATSAAKESVTYIEATDDGKIKLLNFNKEEIITVDVFCGDDDTLYRYTDGMLSVVGIKERNKDKTFRLWVGTNEECVALPKRDPETLYWITDDKTFDEVVNVINALSEAFAKFEKDLIEDGKVQAHSSKCAEYAKMVEGTLLSPNADGNGAKVNTPGIYAVILSEPYEGIRISKMVCIPDLDTPIRTAYSDDDVSITYSHESKTISVSSENYTFIKAILVCALKKEEKGES